MSYKPYKMKHVYSASEKERFTVISTFAGGGGSSTGYRMAGGKILCINEFVEEASKTYGANYPDTPILLGDIKDISGKDFLKIASIQKGALDILDGSPPCSAFSVAGAMCSTEKYEEIKNLFGETVKIKVKSSHDDAFNKTKNYSDGKKITNIEDLFFEYLRVAKDIQPKVIVAENVKGLTMEGAREYLNKITNEFGRMGYLVSYEVLNSVKFGVAQTRERVIFIGVRDDVAAAIGLNFLNINAIFPKGTSEVISIGEVLKDIEQDEAENKKMVKKFKGSAVWKNCVVHMPTNPVKILTGMDFHPTGSYFNTKRAAEFLPSPTVTATSSGAVHWNEARKFNVAELKRIMSLPDDFILTGKYEKQAERCGRMVPPKMMYALAVAIYERVLKPYKQSIIDTKVEKYDR